jgi:hypothetical protein
MGRDGRTINKRAYICYGTLPNEKDELRLLMACQFDRSLFEQAIKFGEEIFYDRIK